MNIDINFSLKTKYNSKSQLARVITEKWGTNNLGCPICHNKQLKPYPNNKKVYDFYCEICGENFQLKSSSKPFGKKLLGSEYFTFIKNIKNNLQPNFFLLQYNCENNKVENLIFIPRKSIITSIVEKRKPLSQNARRAGWTGCNILLEKINTNEIIYIIKNYKIVQQKEIKIESNPTSWYVEVLKIVGKLNNEFTLPDIYKYEKELLSIFPNNNNIQAKIRQQLQFIRDNGLLEFIERGKYKKIGTQI